MAIAKEDVYTIEDIYALPDGQRAELIDGQMHMMTPPNRLHQKLINEISYHINHYIKEHHGSCEVYPAPFAVFLGADNRTYVEPDISVICDKDKLDARGCSGAPDWIIEVISPSTQHMDYGTKLFLYRSAGVREYWIVNPVKKAVNVYNFETDGHNCLYSFDDNIPVGIYENLTITLNDLLQN
jgi:Uma2 family endonuclease